VSTQLSDGIVQVKQQMLQDARLVILIWQNRFRTAIQDHIRFVQLRVGLHVEQEPFSTIHRESLEPIREVVRRIGPHLKTDRQAELEANWLKYRQMKIVAPETTAADEMRRVLRDIDESIGNPAFSLSE
jgi:hypothetical protein